MVGCFSCLGPSDKGKNKGVKESSKKDGSGPQSRNTSKVSSGKFKLVLLKKMLNLALI